MFYTITVPMTDWCSLHNIILQLQEKLYMVLMDLCSLCWNCWESDLLYTRSQSQCSTPKSSIPICAKVEITPPELYIRSQGWNRKKLFNLPQVLINVELYGLVLAPRLKQGIPSNLRGQFATLGANVPASINILTSMF
jgi:hypothetical protein